LDIGPSDHRFCHFRFGLKNSLQPKPAVDSLGQTGVIFLADETFFRRK